MPNTEPRPEPQPEAKPRLPWPQTTDDLVTPGLRAAASWAWRFLLVIAAIVVIGHVLGYLATVTVPLAVALLLAALLNPLKDWLVRKGMHRALAAPLVFITGFLAVAGLISVVVQQFIKGAPKLGAQAAGGLAQIRDWIENTLGFSDAQIDGAISKMQDWFTNNQDKLTSGALSTATSAGHFVAGFFLMLFTLFFFLKDGRRIWNWVIGLAPPHSRAALDGAGEKAWETLAGYVKATALVALVDAVGIGIGLLIVGVPLALPLAALVFLTSFIPLVGATLSGLVAILVALVTLGPVPALIVLAIVLGVQQLEGHLLQPLLMGRAVKIHPLAVVLAIAVGAIVAGIVGALLAVPIAAALNAALAYLHGKPTPLEEEAAKEAAEDDAESSEGVVETK